MFRSWASKFPVIVSQLGAKGLSSSRSIGSSSSSSRAAIVVVVVVVVIITIIIIPFLL